MRALIAAIVFAIAVQAVRASQYAGQVTFGGLPVPGATVTASRGETKVVTTTDAQGVYRFADLPDGTWTITIEMLGFMTTSGDVMVGAEAPAKSWALALRPFEEIAKDAPKADAPEVRLKPDAAPVAPSAAAGRGNTPPAAPFRRAEVTTQGSGGSTGSNGSNGSQNAPPANAASAATAANAADSSAAADGLLVNGSVNNGAASPFAQLAAFGNNRRGARSLYNWGLGVIFGSSALDARPYSFTAQPAPKPSYSNLQVLGTFGGPIKIPGVIQNRPNVFVAYQRSADDTARTQSTIVPTDAERRGDFSQSATRVIDPNTGLPFPGNLIPADRITHQASTLLGYYPQANVLGAAGANFQAPVLSSTHQDSVQTRVTQNLSNRTQLFGSLGYQRTNTDTTSILGFQDETISSGMNGIVNYAHRFSPFWQLRLRYQFDRSASDTAPFFANRTNVAAAAGIGGTDQDPLFWGPPTLLFSNGTLALSDGLPASNHARTHTAAVENLWNHGRHNVTFGAGVHHTTIDAFGQQDPRGTFSFTGGTTGDPFADFLLGRAQTSGIAYGIANKSYRAMSGEAYVTDDWRVSPVLTLNVGMRWEYEGPLTEQSGNLVNLAAAPGFTSVAQVVGGSPLKSDWRGLEPRLAMAWRPIAGSSLVVRAGYGIYRNTNVYQSVETLLAQQPPLSKTFSVQTTPAAPLTLESGLVNPPVPAAANTFAVDPELRVGFAQNWTASLQRDLPGSMTIVATYLGAKGSNLFQEFLPNTFAPGAANPCLACPSGFVFLTSSGRSIRNAAQLEVRRRLRNGFTATVQYTLAKAMDDAGAFNNVSLAGSGIAQDWRNLAAEWAPSNFDQRHLLTVQAQYTTGVGVGGGALLTGRTGTLVKNWTVQTQMTVGSGTPLTPILLAPIPGTAVTGALRASLTGATTDPISGRYLNPAAYASPATGQFGDAGRNSITGPAQFSMNAGVTRSFPLGERLNLDWRIDFTNVLNRVTYSDVSRTFGSDQFGAPIAANAMRKVLTTVRLRF